MIYKKSVVRVHSLLVHPRREFAGKCFGDLHREFVRGDMRSLRDRSCAKRHRFEHLQSRHQPLYTQVTDFLNLM